MHFFGDHHTSRKCHHDRRQIIWTSHICDFFGSSRNLESDWFKSLLWMLALCATRDAARCALSLHHTAIFYQQIPHIAQRFACQTWDGVHSNVCCHSRPQSVLLCLNTLRIRRCCAMQRAVCGHAQSARRFPLQRCCTSASRAPLWGTVGAEASSCCDSMWDERHWKVLFALCSGVLRRIRLELCRCVITRDGCGKQCYLCCTCLCGDNRERRKNEEMFVRAMLFLLCVALPWQIRARWPMRLADVLLWTWNPEQKENKYFYQNFLGKTLFLRMINEQRLANEFTERQICFHSLPVMWIWQKASFVFIF